MSLPDVAVIGGGAVGASIAYELATAGMTVELYEAGSTLAAGCSWGSAGLIAPSHSTPLATPQTLLEGLRETAKPAGAFAIRPHPETLPWLARFAAACRPAAVQRGTQLMHTLCVEGLRLHRQWADDGLATGFQQTGVLYVQRTKQRAHVARERSLRHAAAGVSAQTFDACRALRFEPALKDVAGAVLYTGDARCDPPAFVEAVATAAHAHGATIKTGARVCAITVSRHGATVHLHGEKRRAKTVVVAAGVGSKDLLKPLRVTLPVIGGRGYAVELEPSEEDPKVPIYIEEDRVVVTPLRDRLRVSGILVLGSRHERFNPRRVAGMTRATARSIRGVTHERERLTWSGLRPLSPDGLPIIGRPDGTPSLIIATGHGMMGMTLAPITGALVRDAILDDHEHGELSPDRFHSLTRRDA